MNRGPDRAGRLYTIFRDFSEAHLYLPQSATAKSRTDDLPLDPDAQAKQNRRDGENLPAHLLPRVHLGLGGPVEELHHILGHL